VLYTLSTPDVADLLRAGRSILASVLEDTGGLLAELRSSHGDE
jgi:ArsR family transcriptional regulator